MASKTQKAAAQAPRNSHADKKEPITVPEALTPPVVMRELTPEEYVNENYWQEINSQNIPGILRAILVETVKTRMGR